MNPGQASVLTDAQLDWLAEQAGWRVDRDWPVLYWKEGEHVGTDLHPSMSLDQLVADHDGWTVGCGIEYALTRQAGGWRAEMWGGPLDGPEDFDADAPEAALAAMFFHALRGNLPDGAREQAPGSLCKHI